jgi:hypothetical protein
MRVYGCVCVLRDVGRQRGREAEMEAMPGKKRIEGEMDASALVHVVTLVLLGIAGHADLAGGLIGSNPAGRGPAADDGTATGLGQRLFAGQGDGGRWGRMGDDGRLTSVDNVIGPLLGNGLEALALAILLLVAHPAEAAELVVLVHAVVAIDRAKVVLAVDGVDVAVKELVITLEGALEAGGGSELADVVDQPADPLVPAGDPAVEDRQVLVGAPEEGHLGDVTVRLAGVEVARRQAGHRRARDRQARIRVDELDVDWRQE